ncbi:MAG: V-type ATPase 116kDa subunit family protein [Nitrososphaerota archaeon]
MLRAAPMKKLRAIVYEKYIDNVIYTLGKLGIMHFSDFREKKEEIEGIENVRPSELLFKYTNLLSRIDKLIEDFGISLKEIPSETISIDDLSSLVEEIDKNVTRIEEKYKGIKDEIQSLSQKKAQPDLPEKEKALIELAEKAKEMEYIEFIEKNKEHLIEMKRKVEIGKKFEEIKQFFGKTRKTFIIEGWVPKERSKEVIEAVEKAANGFVTIEEIEEEHEAPVFFKTPSFLEPFVKLLYAYGVPLSHEINPVMLMFITFPFVYGIMFADIGHASIMAIGGILLAIARRQMMRKGVRMDGILGMVISAGELLALCGAFGVFWGFIFGEIFGMHEFLGFHLHPIEIGKIGRETLIGGFVPSEDIMAMFHFAIFVGVCQITLGLILNLANKIVNKEYKEVVSVILWMWFYNGAAYAFFNYGSTQILRIDFWIVNPQFLLIPFVLMVIYEGFTRKIEGASHAFMALIESLSHTVSFGRLLALNLIHASMGKMFIQMMGEGPMQILGILIGTLLALILEGTIIFVHTLRLHWVEWFSKFYTGGGMKYTPFEMKNVRIVSI